MLGRRSSSRLVLSAKAYQALSAAGGRRKIHGNGGEQPLSYDLRYDPDESPIPSDPILVQFLTRPSGVFLRAPEFVEAGPVPIHERPTMTVNPERRISKIAGWWDDGLRQPVPYRSGTSLHRSTLKLAFASAHNDNKAKNRPLLGDELTGTAQCRSP